MAQASSSAASCRPIDTGEHLPDNGRVGVSAIAAKLKQAQAQPWWMAGGLTLAWFLGFALVGSQPDSADTIWTTSGVLLYLAAWIGGMVDGLVMGAKVDWSPRTSSGWQRRTPQLGRDRRGPDEPAPAGGGPGEMARRDPQRPATSGWVVQTSRGRWLGLSAAQAARVVEARQQLNRFDQVEDLMNLAGLEPSTYDQVRDRIILL